MNISPLEESRKLYKPRIPTIFQSDLKKLCFQNIQNQIASQNPKVIEEIFPHTHSASAINFCLESNNKQENTQQNPIKSKIKIGVILSGGPAPGGHNVIAGLFDSMKKLFDQSQLYGFIDGPQGVIDCNYIEITEELINQYRNTGGFDMLHSGRTKLEGIEIFQKVTQVCQKLNLDALVIVGGDDSNTNTAVLAEFFLTQNLKTRVIGCPKTIDGDLKNPMIETSFGFDTACRTYAEIIGNIAKDTYSVRKYWHFIRLMGRTASHITLECALQTQPNITIISEEVAQNKTSLREIIDNIVNIVISRSSNGKNFGILLIPEGLIEFIPEIQSLITELNTLLGHEEKAFSHIKNIDAKINWVLESLSPTSQKVYNYLPKSIQEQMITERDPHGNVQVSMIETEKLLIDLVKDKLDSLASNSNYNNLFKVYGHFLGYEGRCAFPTNFDSDYCYTLGYTTTLLIAKNFTGYMSCVQNLHTSTENWKPCGIPITTMMNLEERKGKQKPVITKTLVDLNGKPFRKLIEKRDTWAKEDCFKFPGPIQYNGPDSIAYRVPLTLEIEKNI